MPSGLTGLALSAGALSPAFDPSVLSYTVIPSATTLGIPFTVTPTATVSTSVVVNGGAVPSGVASQALALALLAPTPIDVAVRSSGGTTTHYALIVPAVQEAYVKASNTRANAIFGGAVALSADGSTLAVGSLDSSGASGINANQADTSAPSAGAVHVFTRVGTMWAQQAYIKASNATQGTAFGLSLALSSDGSTLVVSAEEENSAATGINGNEFGVGAPESGAAYVFARVGSTWAQQAYVKASNARKDAVRGARFGSAVALSSDGNTLAVGALQETSGTTGIDGDQADTAASSAGAVYVFTRVGGTWVQQAYIKASNTRANAYFGAAVALSSDGNTLAVGSWGESSAAAGINGNQADTSALYAGAVYVFSRVGTMWAQDAYVKASNARASGGLGNRHSVALSSDGNTLAVGSYGESSGTSGINGNQADTSAPGAGAIYVFLRVGGNWAQQAYVKASFTRTATSFGWSVTLSSDGNTLAAGAYHEYGAATGINGNQANLSASNAGAVYVFARIGSTWAQQAYVKASNPAANAEFGYSIAISSDGSTLAVGSDQDSSNATGINGNEADTSASMAGAVYVFR